MNRINDPNLFLDPKLLERLHKLFGKIDTSLSFCQSIKLIRLGMHKFKKCDILYEIKNKGSDPPICKPIDGDTEK